MAAKSRDPFDALLDQYDAEILKAFEDAVQDLRTAADIERVIKALSAGRIDEAIAALHLDPAAFADLNEKIAAAYNAGGKSAVAGMPRLTDGAGAKFVIRFNGRNLRAEDWLKSHSTELVTRIIADQKT